MGARTMSMVAAVLSLALVVAGCGRFAPEITDEQVEAWHALGGEMIPAATAIDVEASEVTTMGGNSNHVVIEVSFADFADIKGSDQAVADFEAAVKERVPRAAVTTVVINEGAEVFEAAVASRVLESVPGVESVYASSSFVSSRSGNEPALSVVAYVYVTSPDVIDAAWLDSVANHSQDVASEAGGRIYSIVALPAEVVELDLGDPEVEQAVITVENLPAFAGADTGCVRTESWAYDISDGGVKVYLLNSEGACE